MNLRHKQYRGYMILKEGDEYRFCNVVQGIDADDLWPIAIPGHVLSQALAAYNELKEADEETNKNSRFRRRPPS